ncbi:hypothetical protein GIB67_019806, partial [Kingdonia uniflora]
NWKIVNNPHWTSPTKLKLKHQINISHTEVDDPMRDVSHQTLRLRRFRPRNQGGGALEDSRTYVVCIPVSSSSSCRTCTKSVQWNSSGNLEVFRGIFHTPRLCLRVGNTRGVRIRNPNSN